jgi:hypothetical protein
MGGVNSVRAEMLLFAEALKNGPYWYYHLISGNDLLIKPIGSLIKYLDNKQSSFLYHKDDQSQNSMRLGLYRRLFKDERLENYSIIIQNKIGINRLNKLNRQYSIIKRGWNWGSFTEDAVNLLLSQKNKIAGFTYASICADEMYKQIVLLNSELPVVMDGRSDGIRYIDWRAGGMHPRTFKSQDFEELRDSKYFIARKFDEDLDRNIIDAVTSQLT